MWYGSCKTTADTDNVSRPVAQDLEAPGEASPGDDESTTEASGGTAWQAYNSRWEDTGYGGRWSGWGGWSWHHPWNGPGANWDWSSSTSTISYETQPVEPLPSFIQGWYLLADAGLDNSEKNLVMTALAGNFQPDRVAQELRNQFPESEVKKRDGHRRYQA